MRSKCYTCWVAGLVVLLTGVIWRASPEETVFRTWTRPSLLPT